MSYPYRVVVTKAVEESVDANDRVVTKVTLTPILPKEAMKEVLKGVLEKKGWKERKDGKLEKKGPD